MLIVAAISFHVVAPSIVEVLGSWPRVSSVAPLWLVIIVACEALSFGSAITLQRIALRTDAWFPVATSQLSGNAMSQIMPGGAAAGATLQLRMLGRAGNNTTTAIAGFTAFSLLQTASILFLPVLTLPTILAGAPVDRSLASTAFLGIGGFVAVAALGAVLLSTDPLLVGIGRAFQAARNRILRRRPPITGLPEKLIQERNSIREVLGERWREALLATACRLGFDFLALFAALAAVGGLPRPSLRVCSLHRRVAAGDDPDHPRRARPRRGRAHRRARAGGREPGAGRARDAALPVGLVLAADLRGPGRVHALPPPLPLSGTR